MFFSPATFFDTYRYPLEFLPTRDLLRYIVNLSQARCNDSLHPALNVFFSRKNTAEDISLQIQYLANSNLTAFKKELLNKAFCNTLYETMSSDLSTFEHRNMIVSAMQTMDAKLPSLSKADLQEKLAKLLATLQSRSSSSPENLLEKNLVLDIATLTNLLIKQLIHCNSYPVLTSSVSTLPLIIFQLTTKEKRSLLIDPLIDKLEELHWLITQPVNQQKKYIGVNKLNKMLIIINTLLPHLNDALSKTLIKPLLTIVPAFSKSCWVITEDSPNIYSLLAPKMTKDEIQQTFQYLLDQYQAGNLSLGKIINKIFPFLNQSNREQYFQKMLQTIGSYEQSFGGTQSLGITIARSLGDSKPFGVIDTFMPELDPMLLITSLCSNLDNANDAQLFIEPVFNLMRDSSNENKKRVLRAAIHLLPWCKHKNVQLIEKVILDLFRTSCYKPNLDDIELFLSQQHPNMSQFIQSITDYIRQCVMRANISERIPLFNIRYKYMLPLDSKNKEGTENQNKFMIQALEPEVLFPVNRRPEIENKFNQVYANLLSGWIIRNETPIEFQQLLTQITEPHPVIADLQKLQAAWLSHHENKKIMRDDSILVTSISP